MSWKFVVFRFACGRV